MLRSTTRVNVSTFLVAFLSIFLLAASGIAGESSFEGYTVTSQVPSSRESFDTPSPLAPALSSEPGAQQVKPFLTVPPNRVDAVPGNDFPPILAPETAPLSADPAVLAPALLYGFTGPGDANTVIPPNVMGAAGPSHLVSAINSGVAIFNKSTGVKISEVTLQTFFASLNLGPITPFDPKIIYDQYSGRFVITAGASPYSNPNSWRLIAVSSTSNPTDNWYKWAIDADVNNGTTQTSYWADYNGLGVDNDYIYTTANMFDNFSAYGYAKAWVISKAQLLAGNSTITWVEFTNMTPGVTGFPQPAHAFGTTDAEYFIQEGSYSKGPPARNSLKVASITFPGGVPTWTNLGHVEVSAYPSGSTPGAPQKDSTLQIVAGGDTRILNVVQRNGYLWATHGVPDSTDTRTEVAWYQIDPASADPFFPGGAPTQQGRIADPNRYYYFPSIAVNANNDVGIGFSGSSSTEFAGAFYTARKASDPAGTMQAVAMLKAGEATYYKTFGTGVNRWGDYNAACVDPVDDLTFWTLVEYAGSQVGGISRWGTWWGSFQVDPPPATAVTVTPSPASPRNVGTSVTWTAAASGGSGSYQYQFWLFNGTSWSLAKPYGATNDNNWTWNTTGLAPGSYVVHVWARNAGSTAEWEATAPYTSYVLQPSSGPATAVTVTPSPAGPQNVGTTVTWTAAASGGSGPYEYQFWLYNGIYWSIVKPYGAQNNNTWTWDTAGLAGGTYKVVVYARNVGSVEGYEAFSADISYVLQAGPATAVTVSPSPASPQAVGTSVTWTAAASGGSGTYEYQFWLYNGIYWSIVKPYGATNDNTWTWNTAGLAAATYKVVVYARNAGSAEAYEAFSADAFYVLQAGQP